MVYIQQDLFGDNSATMLLSIHQNSKFVISYKPSAIMYSGLNIRLHVWTFYVNKLLQRSSNQDTGFGDADKHNGTPLCTLTIRWHVLSFENGTL